MTSYDFLSAATNDKDIFHVKYEFEKSFLEKLSSGGAQLYDRAIHKFAKMEWFH